MVSSVGKVLFTSIFDGKLFQGVEEESQGIPGDRLSGRKTTRSAPRIRCDLLRHMGESYTSVVYAIIWRF